MLDLHKSTQRIGLACQNNLLVKLNLTYLYLKWLLDGEQDKVLTFSNPALKSAVWGRERKDITIYFSRSEGFICKVINGLRDSAFQFQLFSTPASSSCTCVGQRQHL